MAIKPIKSSIEVVGHGAHEWENVQAINDNFAELAGGGNTSVTVDSISDATTIGKNVLKSADAAAVRTVIGAGTSNLTIGTTASTAAAGNHTHGNATTSAAGFMSAADKTKLDGVATGATNFTAANATAAVAAKTQIAALTPIADPANADVEAVATLLNSVIVALKA